MTKIPPKPKNYQNTPETHKMPKIPMKPKNYQNTLKSKKKNVKVGKSVFERERERALVQREGS